jgi:hypothetical protein
MGNETRTMNDAAVAKCSRSLRWLLLAILLASALLLQLHLAPNLDFDGELLATDAESLYGLRCVRNGKTPYHDFSHPPHVVTLYGPLFYAVPGMVARLLNTSWIGTIICGRTYNYAAWFGVALLLYALGRQIGCEISLASMAALLWLAGTLAWQWAIAYRPDGAALLLSLGALWVYQRRTSPLVLVTTMVLLVAAFLHKQTSVAVWLAIVATEATQRRWGRAAVMFSGWVIAVAVSVMITQALSQGAFVKNAFGAVMLWVSFDQVWTLLREAITEGIAAFAGGLLAGVMTRSDQRLTLLRRSYAISFALAVAISIKAGANLNYYLEPFAIACILTAALVRQGTEPTAKNFARKVAMGWLGLAIVISTMTLWSRIGHVSQWWHAVVDHRVTRAQQAQEWGRVTNCLGEWKGRVLVEDLYLVVRQPQEVFLLHPRQFEALRETGRFDDTELCRRIAAGGFDTIVANFPLEEKVATRQFPLRWLEAATGRYVMEKRCDRSDRGGAFYVYRPVQGTNEVSVPK